MLHIVSSGKHSLEEQVRAYDLLDALVAVQESGDSLPEGLKEASLEYCRVYDDCKASLDEYYDEEGLKEEVSALLKPLQDALQDAEVKAAKAVELHELAKETYQVWYSSGFFSRHKALRSLRRMAGFRLESHRIGNYVAKTYDLMEEARRTHQQARQALFSSNVSYKCQRGLHAKISAVLSLRFPQ